MRPGLGDCERGCYFTLCERAHWGIAFDERDGTDEPEGYMRLLSINPVRALDQREDDALASCRMHYGNLHVTGEDTHAIPWICGHSHKSYPDRFHNYECHMVIQRVNRIPDTPDRYAAFECEYEPVCKGFLE